MNLTSLGVVTALTADIFRSLINRSKIYVTTTGSGLRSPIKVGFHLKIEQ